MEEKNKGGMGTIQTSQTKFLYRIAKILETIQENTPLNRFVLCRILNITPKQYESIHPYLVEAYGDKIEYNVNSRKWVWIEKNSKKSAKRESQ